MKEVIATLRTRFSVATGAHVTVLRDAANPAIKLLLNKTADTAIGNEGYYLSVAKKGIVIRANEPAGLFYGVQTLVQLFPKEIVSGKHVDFSSFVSSGRSQFGRGGMITKSTMAQKIAQLGIAVHIANGTRENILPDVLAGKVAHTYFVPNKSASGKKKWIAHAGAYAKGVVQVNAGARLALTSAKASSLLPVGVINILSDFKKGEIIKLVDENNNSIGLGIAEYGSEKAAEMMGQKNQKALIHYDYLYLEC